MSNNGGQAFPVPGDQEQVKTPGMWLRDYFAGQFLAAIQVDASAPAGSAALIAKNCYVMADAMIAERGK